MGAVVPAWIRGQCEPRAEKRLLVTKVMDWRLCTHKQQLCSTAYAHAKGEWATAAGKEEAAVIKPYGDGWWAI